MRVVGAVVLGAVVGRGQLSEVGMLQLRVLVEAVGLVPRPFHFHFRKAIALSMRKPLPRDCLPALPLAGSGGTQSAGCEDPESCSP